MPRGTKNTATIPVIPLAFATEETKDVRIYAGSNTHGGLALGGCYRRSGSKTIRSVGQIANHPKYIGPRGVNFPLPFVGVAVRVKDLSYFPPATPFLRYRRWK